MEIILQALLLMCFDSQLCKKQMHECMQPYIRNYNGEQLYSANNLAYFKKCYWGEYISKDDRPWDERLIRYHMIQVPVGEK